VTIASEGLGSSTAFVGLFDGSADLGASSRPINEKELAEAARLGVKLEELVIGFDGIAVIVHPTNPVRALTIDQLSRIFTGEVRNWREVGGDDLPIRLMSRPSYSGTHGFFRDKVLRRGNAKGPEGFAARTEMVEESAQLAERVGDDPAAIAYVGLGWVGADVRALAVAPGDGQPAVPPSLDSVRQGTYPIYRPLLVYTRGAPRGAVAGFLRWVLSPEGQALVEQHGFIRSDVPADAVIPAAAERDHSAPAPAPRPLARITFRAGSARLDAAGLAQVHEVGERLAGSPRSLLVVGHADAEGGRIGNVEMSRLRAATVLAHLRAAGIAPERLQLEAAGSEQPLATNETGEGRGQNRRVEIYLLAR
jgi:phosphate binding protein